MTRRRTPPPRLCHAPRCTVPIKRGMLMCRAHWFQVPRELRNAISLAWKERRISDWSANCLEARRVLAGTPVEAEPKVSAEQAYDLNRRMMGER